jgi:hypothetical protein
LKNSASFSLIIQEEFNELDIRIRENDLTTGQDSRRSIVDDFSESFTLLQLAPILYSRNTIESAPEITYFDEKEEVSLAEALGRIVEIPFHTIHQYSPLRIRFDQPFKTFIYVLNNWNS